MEIADALWQAWLLYWLSAALVGSIIGSMIGYYTIKAMKGIRKWLKKT